jgi:ferrous iron transport protein A
MNGKILPLSFVQSGRRAVIKEFTGCRNLSRRLTEMGLIPGSRLRVIRNDCGSPLIVSLGEGRLALGSGMALKIMVEDIGEE